MQYEINQDIIETIGDNASIIFEVIKYMDTSGWLCRTKEGTLLTEVLIDSIETILYSIMPLYNADSYLIKELLWKLLIEQLTN